jgi:hypothetical protein
VFKRGYLISGDFRIEEDTAKAWSNNYTRDNVLTLRREVIFKGTTKECKEYARDYK